MTDVRITSPQYGDMLYYSGVSWVNDFRPITDSKSITVENPTSSENIIMFYSFDQITILQIQAVVKATAGSSITIDPLYGTSVTGGTTHILSSATVISNTTTGQSLTTFNSSDVPASNWILLTTTALSGVVTQLSVSVKYRKI